jgi:putative flippase GtrA
MHYTLLLKRLIYRGSKYSIGGISTLLIDLVLVYILTTFFAVHINIALVMGFLFGISINYLISYLWVFKGTKRTPLRGYVYFLIIGALTGLCISFATTSLITHTALTLLEARVWVAMLAGITNFLLNTFLNFRLL